MALLSKEIIDTYMTQISKPLVVVFLVFIFYSLGSALYFLIKDRAESTRIVKALTWRIGLSIVLFIFLMFAYAMGWIKPHSI